MVEGIRTETERVARLWSLASTEGQAYHMSSLRRETPALPFFRWSHLLQSEYLKPALSSRKWKQYLNPMKNTPTQPKLNPNAEGTS